MRVCSIDETLKLIPGEPLNAARWHGRAAQWVGFSDLTEMARHWGRVWSLLQQAPDSPETQSLGVAACLGLLAGGWRIGMSEDELDAVVQRGKELACYSGDARVEALIMTGYATARGFAGDVKRYVEHAREAARLARRSGDPASILAMKVNLVYSHFSAGHLAKAWRLVRPRLWGVSVRRQRLP